MRKKQPLTEAQIAERRAKKAAYMREWSATLTPEEKAARYEAQHAAYKRWYLKKKAADPEGMKAANRAKVNAYYKANPEKMREIQRRQREALKAQVFAHYGEFCACCGENEIEFLCIDHIAGDGAAHRRRETWSYGWLRKKGFPAGFQTLCHNCNFAKQQLSECPHATIVRRKLTLVKP